MAASKRYSHSETRKEEHLRFLEQLKSLPLTESCCEICHCDCFNSHRSSESEKGDFRPQNKKIERSQLLKHAFSVQLESNASGNKHSHSKQPGEASKLKNKHKIHTKKFTKKKASVEMCTKGSAACKTPEPGQFMKRSRSANSMHSQQSGASVYSMRDCRILQKLLTSLADGPEAAQRLQVLGRSKKSLSRSDNAKLNEPEPNATPVQLCESMANLCLSPKVRKAFQTVPPHDKRILNRMAKKRGECIVAKENAWLARKYWENERYERELLRCEEMDEYKKAVLDKQLQDDLRTKARINEIAQRDLAELQHLRGALQEKDERVKRRLEAVRTDRGITHCQSRCNELTKCEAVNVHQEEQQLDEELRKKAICQRLSERLERADQLRSQILENYLKRVRYDNYLEQLMHEEKWRQTQKSEQQKREQLQEHISRKRNKSQRFVENRQRRNAAQTRTAKISASLRELVRNSVTPESAMATDGNFTGAVPRTLSRLLLEGPNSKMSTQ